MNKFDKDMEVATSFCDFRGRLGITDTFNLNMDVAAEHAEKMGVGLQYMKEHGLFWVAIRIRLHFYHKPFMHQNVTVSTWPSDIETMRCCRCFEIHNNGENKDLLVSGKTEWACLSMANGRPQPVAQLFPNGYVAYDGYTLTEPFAHLKTDFAPEEKRASHIVSSSDIDIGQHMNNCAYIRALLNAFTVKERKQMAIDDIEVAYLAQSFEGEELSVMVHPEDDGYSCALVKADGKNALLARIKACKLD